MGKRKLPSYLWNVEDWKLSKEFIRLSPEQKSWYRALLDECWFSANTGYLDVDEEDLKYLSGFTQSWDRLQARALTLRAHLIESKAKDAMDLMTNASDLLELVIVLSMDEWQKDMLNQWKGVLKQFKHGESGWYNERLLEAREHVERVNKQRTLAGKAGARGRWSPQKSYIDEPDNDKCQTDAMTNVWQTPSERIANATNIKDKENTNPLASPFVPRDDEEEERGREKRFLLSMTWHPSRERIAWLYAHFPQLKNGRLEEIIREDFVPYWTDPVRAGATKTQRGWEMTLNNRLKQLRDSGRLVKGNSHVTNNSDAFRRAAQQLGISETEDHGVQAAGKDPEPLLDP